MQTVGVKDLIKMKGNWREDKDVQWGVVATVQNMFPWAVAIEL